MILLSAFAFSPPGPLRGSERGCVGGRLHTLEYTATTGGAVLDLDGALGSKLDKVTCDLDHTKLTLSFKHRADAVEWIVKVRSLPPSLSDLRAMYSCPMLLTARLKHLALATDCSSTT